MAAQAATLSPHHMLGRVLHGRAFRLLGSAACGRTLVDQAARQLPLLLLGLLLPEEVLPQPPRAPLLMLAACCSRTP